MAKQVCLCGIMLLCCHNAWLIGRVLLSQSLLKARASFEDTDDRRFVFQIVLPKTKKGIVLQAANAKQLRHWVCLACCQHYNRVCSDTLTIHKYVL
jgi:hypothetical protein